MEIYKTSDGESFRDQWRAVVHQQVLDYHANSGFDNVAGKPYSYGRIETIEMRSKD